MEQELQKREQENKLLKENNQMIMKKITEKQKQLFLLTTQKDELTLELNTTELNLKKKEKQIDKLQESIQKLERKRNKIEIEATAMDLKFKPIEVDQALKETSFKENGTETEETLRQQITGIENEIKLLEQEIRMKMEARLIGNANGKLESEETLKRVEHIKELYANKLVSLSKAN